MILHDFQFNIVPGATGLSPRQIRRAHLELKPAEERICYRLNEQTIRTDYAKLVVSLCAYPVPEHATECLGICEVDLRVPAAVLIDRTWTAKTIAGWTKRTLRLLRKARLGVPKELAEILSSTLPDIEEHSQVFDRLTRTSRSGMRCEVVARFGRRSSSLVVRFSREDRLIKQVVVKRTRMLPIFLGYKFRSPSTKIVENAFVLQARSASYEKKAQVVARIPLPPE